jgi:hypothetical protein
VRKSTSEPNELNHNIWLTIDPCAQSSFAVPDYWKDLLLQSNTRHKQTIYGSIFHGCSRQSAFQAGIVSSSHILCLLTRCPFALHEKGLHISYQQAPPLTHTSFLHLTDTGPEKRQKAKGVNLVIFSIQKNRPSSKLNVVGHCCQQNIS